MPNHAPELQVPEDTVAPINNVRGTDTRPEWVLRLIDREPARLEDRESRPSRRGSARCIKYH
jgi:hypothetical protein